MITMFSLVVVVVVLFNVREQVSVIHFFKSFKDIKRATLNLILNYMLKYTIKKEN